eukprot:g1059.t1
MADSDEHSESEQLQGGNEQEVFWGKKEYYGGSDQEDASEDFNSDAERELREKAEKRKILLQKATKHFVEDDTSSEDEEAEGRGSDEDAEDSKAGDENDENSAVERDDGDAGILEAEELKTSLLNDNADGTDSKSSSKLSRKQKEFWLSKLAPELAPLVQEYLEELTYLDEVLLPESQKASSIVNQDESMKQYVELRKGFAQQYVSLLSFYLYKKKTSVEDILTRGGTAAAARRRTGAVSQTSSDYLQSHPVFEKILELKEVRTEFRDRDDMLLEAIDMGEDEEEQEEDDMHMNEESISGNPPLQQRVDREADEEEEDEEDIEMLSTGGESDSDLRGGEQVEVGDVIGNALRNFNSKANGVKASKDAQQLSTKNSTPSPCSDRTDSTSTGQNLSARERMLQKLAALKNGGKQIVESAGRGQVVKGGVMSRGTVKHASRNEVTLHKFNSHDDPTLGKMQERKKSALQKYMVEGQKIHNAIGKKQGNSDVLVDFKERKGGVQRFDDGLPAEFLERQEKEELRKAEEDAAAKKKKAALASKKRLQEQTELVDESMLTEGQRQHLELEEDEQRLATKKILQNRGLVRIRPKKDRNSRVKHRRKYEKAVKKRKTVVATMREGTSTGDAYGGETTGIRSTVIKSHKL